MSLETQLAGAVAEARKVFDLVTGQFGKWDGQVKAQINLLEQHKAIKNTSLTGGSNWNRFLKINHRSTYKVSVFTTGGSFSPGVAVFYISTGYTMTGVGFDINNVTTVHKKSNYATKVRFTADNAGLGGGYLDIFCVGANEKQIGISVVYIQQKNNSKMKSGLAHILQNLKL